MQKESRNWNKFKLLAAFLFLTSLALLLSTAGVTLAKYIADTRSEGMATAKPFYFSSDRLTPEGAYYQLEEPLGDADATCSFTLTNYIDSLRCTNEDIAYYYEVQSFGGTMLAQESGTLVKGSPQTKEVSLTLKKADFGQGGRVTVTAHATAPYKKTISAQFGFSPDVPSLQYSVSQQDNAVILSVAGGADKQVTVTWPTTLTPDLSNPVFLGGTPVSTTFMAESGVRYALTFLKNDPSQSYRKEDFTVAES